MPARGVRVRVPHGARACARRPSLVSDRADATAIGACLRDSHAPVLHCSPLDSCCTHALCIRRCSEPAARRMYDALAGPFSVGGARYILHAALVCEWSCYPSTALVFVSDGPGPRHELKHMQDVRAALTFAARMRARFVVLCCMRNTCRATLVLRASMRPSQLAHTALYVRLAARGQDLHHRYSTDDFFDGGSSCSSAWGRGGGGGGSDGGDTGTVHIRQMQRTGGYAVRCQARFAVRSIALIWIYSTSSLPIVCNSHARILTLWLSVLRPTVPSALEQMDTWSLLPPSSIALSVYCRTA
jgi:hypothetical protein